MTEPQEEAPIRKRPLAVAFFFLFALLVLAGVARVLAPFAAPILLAIVVVTFTFGSYKKLCVRFNGRTSLAAAVMLILVTFVIVIPAFVFTWLLIDQATHLLQAMQHVDVNQIRSVVRSGERMAWLQRFIPWIDLKQLQLENVMINAIREIPAFVAVHGGRFLAGFANALIGFVLMLVASYYFYTEGEYLAGRLRFLSPLPDQYDREIFQKFRGIIDATFKGQLLTALAQGAATAIGLAIAGVPAPIFWGAVASLFSLLPMVGAASVWVPAAAYLFIRAATGNGGWFGPIFLLVWGVAVVSMVDNLVRPWAMKGGTNLSAVILFFAIFGGIQAFGFVGLIIGPLLFALLASVIDIYQSFFGKALVDPDGDPPPEAAA